MHVSFIQVLVKILTLETDPHCCCERNLLRLLGVADVCQLFVVPMPPEDARKPSNAAALYGSVAVS